jgi:hypothetical protein
MRSFREATRIFWVGWAEIFDYLAAVKEHAWEVLWGAGVIGVVFGIATLYWSPSWHAFGYVLALLVFVAGYQLWRDYHLRLQPKLRVTRIIAQTTPAYGRMLYDKSPMPPGGFKGDPTACYFEVAGTSEAVTLKDVRVQIAAIQPAVSSLALLPVYLRQRGDNVMKGVPPAQSFDLHAGEHKIIELVSALTGAQYFTVEHIAWDTNKEIPRGRYRINVNISAENAPTQSLWFTVWMDEAGELQCEHELNPKII